MPNNKPIGAGVVVASLLLVAACAGGCAVPGLIAYKVWGPPPVPARYTPPKDQPLLVLVENIHSGSQAMPEADDLARVVYDDLKANAVAVTLVEPSKVHDLREADPKAFEKMKIAEVGRAVGAGQVVYVNVKQLHFDNPPGSEMVKVTISADVKVVDAATARTVWPETGEAETYFYESRLERVTDQSNRSAMSRQVLRDSGEQIARWFYDFKPETMTQENQDVKLR